MAMCPRCHRPGLGPSIKAWMHELTGHRIDYRAPGSPQCCPTCLTGAEQGALYFTLLEGIADGRLPLCEYHAELLVDELDRRLYLLEAEMDEIGGAE